MKREMEPVKFPGEGIPLGRSPAAVPATEPKSRNNDLMLQLMMSSSQRAPPPDVNSNVSIEISKPPSQRLIKAGPSMPTPPPNFILPTPTGSAVPASAEYRSNAEITQPNSLNFMAALLPGSQAFMDDADLTGLSDGQRDAILAILKGKNILLTGPAGTGKTHTINRIKSIYEKKKLTIGLTSTTGASAILIEGKTIHSWAGIGITATKEAALKRVTTYKAPQERIRGTSLLIIDEISMLSSQILDILDYVFRILRGNQRPFGGMQIVLCGDFYQLKPVKSESYAFDSPNWDTYIHEVHELTYIFRQNNEKFCKALNEIRIGEVSPETVELISGCLGREFEGDIKPTVLYPVNEDVDKLNESELWKLASETNMVRAIDALDEAIERPKPRYTRTQVKENTFIAECKARLNKDCIAPEVLQLAIGAQVMLLKNLNVDAGFANGSRGVVVDFGPNNEPVVKFLNQQILQLQTCVWKMTINETTTAKRTQYPLKLAWSMSIHKSQGISVDLVKIDLGAKIFSEGQFYVAASRIRSLDGLSIIALDWDQVLTSKKVKEFYAKYKRDRK